MKVLNSNEMNNVSGGWVAHALGAAAGAYGAGYGYLAGGGKDPNKFLGAVALGGLTGVVSPVNGIRSAAKTAAVSFGGSAATTAIGSPYF